MSAALQFPSAGKPSTTRTLIVDAIRFLCAFALLQLGWQAVHGSAFERFIVESCVVKPAARAANFLTPSIGVHAQGTSLHAMAMIGGGIALVPTIALTAIVVAAWITEDGASHVPTPQYA